MDAVLLDTDVFSYLTRDGHARGDAYRPHVLGKTIAVSFVTVGEVYFGAEKKNWGSRTLSGLLERLKAVIVVPSDLEICREYGRLRASLEKAGIIIPDNDLWIAACALRHSVPLISNNRRHFKRIAGLSLSAWHQRKPPQFPQKRTFSIGTEKNDYLCRIKVPLPPVTGEPTGGGFRRQDIYLFPMKRPMRSRSDLVPYPVEGSHGWGND
jgi:tRNA(fMet)-specific endonuclease VapC